MYYIYEIKDYVWKKKNIGRIGKIGCTDDTKRRALEYKLESLSVLEVHDDIIIASNRELELQREKGYPIDKEPYYETCRKAKLTKTEEALAKRNGSYVYPESGKIKKGTKIEQYSKDGKYIRQWDTIRMAGDSLGVHFVSISNCLRGLSKTSAGYKWKYAS